jgi:type IV pilus assembly protein PilW
MTTLHKMQSKQSGVSLIELMVGLTIGLVLATIASATYLYSKQGFVTNSESAQTEENGRFAINLLTRYIQSSGFATLRTDGKFPTAARDDRLRGCDYGYTEVSAPVDFTCLSAAGTSTLASSSINIVFETDAPSSAAGSYEGRDCIGNSALALVEAGTTKSHQVSSYFYVSSTTVKTEYGTTTMGELSCIPGALGAGASANSQPLIPGIVQLDFGYIVGDRDNQPRTLKTAAQVTAANEWAMVSAVEVCVMAKSVVASGNDTGRTHTDCKGSVISAQPNAIYRNFRSRVNLRNLRLS